ncbi:MAG: DNA mismatch repair protein MutS, partial [Bacteroidota bacterium]
FNDHVLERKRNNFLASVYHGKTATGVALLDISTGEFYCAQGSATYVQKLLQGMTPSELIFAKNQRALTEEYFPGDHAVYALDEWVYEYEFAHERLITQFRTTNLKGFGIDGMEAAIIAAGAILQYLEATEHRETGHITTISRIEEDRYVWLDRFTIRNLELVAAQHDGGVPLLQILDRTVTPMGGRLLRQWMVLPLRHKETIDERLRVVRRFHQDTDASDQLREHLGQVSDLERLISKVSAARINPRELNQLRRSLEAILPVREWLLAQEQQELSAMGRTIDPCTAILERIARELKADAPMLVNQGGVISDGECGTR